MEKSYRRCLVMKNTRMDFILWQLLGEQPVDLISKWRSKDHVQRARLLTKPSMDVWIRLKNTPREHDQNTTSCFADGKDLSTSSITTSAGSLTSKLKMKRKLLFEDDETEENESMLLKKAHTSAETSKGRQDTHEVTTRQ